MPGMFTNPRKQGDIGEMAAALHYTKQGYDVFYPLTASSRADLVVIKEENVVRVQCKTSNSAAPSGAYRVGLVTAGGNQSWNKEHKRLSSKEIDEVFIWCSNGSEWIFPISVLEGRRSVTVGWTNIQYHVSGPKPPEPKRDTHRTGRSKIPVVGVCKICGSDTNTRKQTYCDEHRPRSKAKIDWPDDDALKAMLNESNYSQVGLKLGVSDNAVRKRLSRST